MRGRSIQNFFFFSSRRRHTRSCLVSWARRCVQETGVDETKILDDLKPDYNVFASDLSAFCEEFEKDPTLKAENAHVRYHSLKGHDLFFIDHVLCKPHDSTLSTLKAASRILQFCRARLAIAVALRITKLFAQFMGPIFLDHITDQLHKLQLDNEDPTILTSIGIYFFGILLLYLIQVYCDNHWLWNARRAQTHIGSILRCLLYRKLLRCSTVRKKVDTDFVTLFGLQVDLVSLVVWNFIEGLAVTAEILLIFFMIYMKVGIAVVGGIVAFALLMWLTSYLSKTMRAAYFTMAKFQGERNVLLNDILNGMKSIKYLNWESIFEKRMLNIRELEFKKHILRRICDSGLKFCSACSSYTILIATLVTYAALGREFASLNIFTIIALFWMISYPMSSVPWNVLNTLLASTFFKSLSSYLKEEEMQRSNVHIIDAEDENAVVIKEVEGFHSHEKPISSPHDQGFLLHIPKLEVKKGTLNMIIGKVGSGKTSLLSCILNEIVVREISEDESSPNEVDRLASVNRNRTYRSPIGLQSETLGYVAQNTWLQNCTIKENILFGKEYDDEWYNKCVEACELKEDIDSLRGGDSYNVGPNGNKLSGGQKQRVALCRAVYQDCDIYIFDDIFSSLDYHVCEKIFKKLIQGVLKDRKKTIIMAISQYEFLKYSENIIYMDNGQLLKNHEELDKYMLEQLEQQRQAVLQQDDVERKRKQEFDDDVNPMKSLATKTCLLYTSPSPRDQA
eukprot:TRINITY_DN27095_c0_g1_i3.p1 TRINITY_DN27095_c0_g1~~TRINITY_DN27095_c0_g1_i3.p1  ORF type:complete len:735 (+),score=122.70 TRINITY_DN27095_c0_g1_i3:65-2269(+)